MVWALAILGVVVAAVGVNEWRTRNKPMNRALRDREAGQNNTFNDGLG